MKTIIGIPARSEDYFMRKEITEEIWSNLKKGSNILLVAPRRVGKTSIMLDLLDNPESGFIVIYEDTEPLNKENDFYKKLFTRVNERFKGIKKYKNKVEVFSKDFASRIEQISLADASVTLGESKICYRDELEKLLLGLELGEERLVILVDEFAQTVENIIEDHGEKEAKIFLESKRKIRLNPELAKKVQFVYAGSIGLENVVSNMNELKLINDLISQKINPFNIEEAKALIAKLIDGANIEIKDEAVDYLIQKIEWLIPFYFQLIIDECIKILKTTNSPSITVQTIDKAIDNGLKYRVYFENWFTRLRGIYRGDEFSFIVEVLNTTSINSITHSSDVYNLAVKYKIESSHKNLIKTLIHDGYINNEESSKEYRFNSPLLKEWWYRNVAN